MWLQSGADARRSSAPLSIIGLTTEYWAGTVVSMASSCPFWKLEAAAEGSSIVVMRTESRGALSPHQLSSGSIWTVLFFESIFLTLYGPAVTFGPSTHASLKVFASLTRESGATSASPFQSA
jgi:hypothetical protein